MRLHRAIPVMFFSMFLTACATQAVNTFQPFKAHPIGSDAENIQLNLKTQNLLVIADASASTAATYTGPGFPQQESATKFEIGRELIHRMNQTIPDETNIKAGIRSFGFGPCTDWKNTRLNLGISNYSKSTFGSGLDTLSCSSGGSPMHAALEAAGTDLLDTTEQIAVVIFSAAHELDKSPIAAAKTLKAQYGDRLCIYTVWVGNEENKAGRYLLQQISNIGFCGFATSADEIADSQSMATFVERVLYNRSPVISHHIPVDSDADGVPDFSDKCPDTPKGAKVNKEGCWVYHGVFFDFDKDTIKPEYHDLFENAVHVMEINPTLQVLIKGHTDHLGSAAYNQELSERRAKAVKAYMVNKGVSADRMQTKGYGKSQPIASNHTEEGRAYNRRVEYEIIRH